MKSIGDVRMSDMSIGRFSVGYSQVNVQELEGLLINKQNSPILTRPSRETFRRSDVRNARIKNWSTTTIDDISFDRVRYHKKQTCVLCTRGCAFDFIVWLIDACPKFTRIRDEKIASPRAERHKCHSGELFHSSQSPASILPGC